MNASTSVTSCPAREVPTHPRIAVYDTTGTVIYRGPSAALMEVGLVRRDMLPGEPGNDYKRTLFHCGRPAGYVRRLDLQPDPENWMRIERVGRDEYRVSVGLPHHTRIAKRREACRNYREHRTETRAFNGFMQKLLEPGPLKLSVEKMGEKVAKWDGKEIDVGTWRERDAWAYLLFLFDPELYRMERKFGSL